MKEWADGLKTYYGIAEGDALEYSNMMGSMLQNIGGLSEAEAAKQAEILVQLSGDLTAMFGGTTESAVQALTGALKGNNTMLDNYGMAASDAMVKAKALEMGLMEQGKEMSLSAKQAATLALIMEQSTAAQGQAAREAAGASGSMRTLATETKNLSVSFGEALLPVITPLVTKLKEMVQGFSEISPEMQKTILVVGAIAAAIGPVLIVGGAMVTGFSAIAGAVGAASGAIAAAGGIMAVITGPIGIAVAAVAALVAGGVLLYKNWDTIKAKAQELLQVFAPVWAGIKQAVADAWAYIGPTIMAAVNEISAFWNEIWPQVQQVFEMVWNTIQLFIEPAIAVVYVAISAALGLIQGVWQDAWNLIKDTLKIVWDLITGIIKIAWDIISGVIKVGLDLLTGNWRKAWDDLKGIFVNVWNDIRQLFRNLIADALQYGKDFVQGIIDGITGAIGGVEDAVSALAAKIKSYLHFSTPDIGPLAEYETWMPDFMGGLAKGIDANKYKVTDAIRGLAGNMQLNASLSGVNGSSYSTVNHNGGNITINVNGTGNQLEATLRRLGVKF